MGDEELAQISRVVVGGLSLHQHSKVLCCTWALQAKGSVPGRPRSRCSDKRTPRSLTKVWSERKPVGMDPGLEDCGVCFMNTGSLTMWGRARGRRKRWPGTTTF